jgi:hypothetical protein
LTPTTDIPQRSFPPEVRGYEGAALVNPYP